MVKISHYSGKKTGGNEQSESKASSSGGGSSWSHFSLFHRHSQKQWMLKNAQAKDLSQRKKTLSIRSSKKCYTDKVKRETVDSFLLFQEI